MPKKRTESSGRFTLIAVATAAGVSRVTLWRWMEERRVPFLLGASGRPYFGESERAAVIQFAAERRVLHEQVRIRRTA
jgi:predicted site-specific integrase-resolvase